MNRRNFLQAAAVSTAVLPALGAEPRRIRIGFLGCGHSHGISKVKLALTSPDWECVGIFEPDPKPRTAAEKLGAKALSQEQVLAASEVIAVECEAKDRYQMARAALLAGKHVHIEKPPSVTLAEFRELLGLAQDRNVLMQMGYMWRFNPGINAALEAARKGWLGDVYLVRGVINTNISGESRRSFGEIAGGTMYELGCHLVDPLVRLLGKHAKVTPILRHDAKDADHLADNCVAVFDFKHALGIISSATMQPTAGAHRTFEIQGTNGVAIVRPLEQPVLTVDLAKEAGPYKKGSQVISFPRYERYAPEFAELAACVRTGKPLGVTPEEDALVQEALLKASGMH
ncbi:MAG: Gfo/Idh/MocA family oxidoreductase [Verrucomicrobia bacterium]|nr:Gfo/Idh/MocA family oxidoreductase [Verrucomicrobiota bacterium]